MNLDFHGYAGLRRARYLWLVALTCLAASAVLAAEPASAQQEWTFEGNEVLVSNLIGDITVRGHDGSRIIVRARPGGDDSDILDYQVKQGGRAEFHVVYPLEQQLELLDDRGAVETLAQPLPVPEPFRFPPGGAQLEPRRRRDRPLAAFRQLGHAALRLVDTRLGLRGACFRSAAQPGELPADAVGQRLPVAGLVGQERVPCLEPFGIRTADRQQPGEPAP